jgi:flagellar protein FlaI
MTSKGLPFQPKQHNEGFQYGDVAVRDTLSPALREACVSQPFLGEYVECLPMAEIGVPAFYPTLSRKLQKLERRNLIYPVDKNLFVHIYPDKRGERDYYVAIEPDLTVELQDLLAQVEAELVDFAEEIGAAEGKEAKREVLLQVLEEICTTNPTDGSERIPVTERQMEALRYHFVREKLGLGSLQPLLQDPYIEDISCSGIGPVFIEHRIFRSLQSSIVFDTHDDLDDFVVWMGEAIKRPVTVRNPIVDAVLPDGSRINVVYGREIATRGSNFTIRKFSDKPLSILELIEFNTLTYEMAAYLSLMLEEGMNMFVAGATASGKTTLLNALNTFILPDAKIVSIEDTPEIQVPHKNWCREVTRVNNQVEQGSEVNMFTLLKAALRQRPDRIIIGEIRGEEGRIAFQAMQTGHGVLSTFHAASVEKLLQRLTGDPINVPKTYIDNLNIVAIQAAVRAPDGRTVRRVTSINEILGYDTVSESYSFIEVFRWNPANDTFEFPGSMNSYLLEQRIAPRKGIPPHKRKAIYDELRKRARIFERLHKERGIATFDDFFKILAEAHHQKLI